MNEAMGNELNKSSTGVAGNTTPAVSIDNKNAPQKPSKEKSAAKKAKNAIGNAAKGLGKAGSFMNNNIKKTNSAMGDPDAASSGQSSNEAAEKIAKGAKTATKTTVKTAKAALKTPGRAVKTVKAAKNTVKAAKATVKTARAAVKTARAATHAAVPALKAAKMAIATALKLISSAIKAVAAAVSAAAAATGVVLLIVLLVIIIVLLVYFIFRGSLGAPQSMQVNMVAQYNPEDWEEFKADSGLSEGASLAEIVDFFTEYFGEKFLYAYNEVCYDEIYQACLENDFDWELTQESYKNCEFPYRFGDELTSNFNVNEFITILSMAGYTAENFKWHELKELFEDKEFLRCTYDLKLTPTRYEYDEFDPKTGEFIRHVVTDTWYYEVEIDTYCLKELFDYFGLDPNAVCELDPTFSNYYQLYAASSLARSWDESVNWGSAAISRWYDYSRYTGEITEHYDNIYAKDIRYDPVIGDNYVNNDIPLLSQGNYANVDYTFIDKHGNAKTMSVAKWGCCVTSFCMVASYLTGRLIEPGELLSLSFNRSGLVRATSAAHYGFKEVQSQTAFDGKAISNICARLNEGGLVMAKYRAGYKKDGSYTPGGSDHHIVIKGYNTTEDDGVFIIADPNGGVEYAMEFTMALRVFENYRAYNLE